MSASGGERDGEQGITLMIDNYDSFTYNIVQYLAQLGANGEHITRTAPRTRTLASLAPYHGLSSVSALSQSACTAMTRLPWSRLWPSTPPTS